MMTMKTLFVVLLTVLVALAMLVPEPAEAKRFGAGRSLGEQYSIPQRASAAASPLDEVWHVARDWASADGTWTIIGIQQSTD